MGIFSGIINTIAPIFIATSPITSYADQIYSIHRNRSSAGFSLDIPLIMLVASILKLFYYPTARYALSLLFQALLTIAVQLVLLHVALIHRPRSTAHHAPFSTVHSSSRPFNFWQWRDYKTYFQALGGLVGGLLALQLLLSPHRALYESYTGLLGSLALAIEATLPMPQLLANQRRRCCKGFRVSVVANWILGDVFKMTFFLLQGSGEGGVPFAFKACAAVQMACDIGLGIQFFVFGDDEPMAPGGGGGLGVGGEPGVLAGEKVELEKVPLS